MDENQYKCASWWILCHARRRQMDSATLVSDQIGPAKQHVSYCFLRAQQPQRFLFPVFRLWFFLFQWCLHAIELGWPVNMFCIVSVRNNCLLFVVCIFLLRFSLDTPPSYFVKTLEGYMCGVFISLCFFWFFVAFFRLFFPLIYKCTFSIHEHFPKNGKPFSLYTEQFLNIWETFFFIWWIFLKYTPNIS